MADFFEFEADFVDSLRCIPMQVRYKLDTSGIKLKLSHWHQMTQDERAALVELPCNTQTEIQAYQNYLQQLILERTGNPPTKLPIEPDPLWMDSQTVPASIQEKAQEMGITLTLQQWTALTPLQRFALIKLSRPGHENKNFSRAIAEFHLLA
ncbi:MULTISPECIES: nitrate reductase associated protein [Cyanophyceae]|uniref:Nitrate reductase associated protein n=1 Tax=Nodularia spumigena CENA596 TaxID=1819295 RepID=A0A166I5E9_NODSP|nr:MULTISPECIES: nitrate reductase associated protein [Cyanophyceae]MDB9355583.1 nitrate reductase associated protein [Nodularia spumigena CS-587/03]KZL47908.1 nitrate reductase associated protein [Nodularia spumigena CENA596]MDB9322612.1 nitrate reductase associated protein [Nodularia spumigena CS-591/07A]MDB9331252.1 nitrate reductase associated protein [Nodularia spumigena CS-591/04]MDB9339686.1 nitrate reductase associated protein [Nodularia spumigena CS-589/07]